MDTTTRLSYYDAFSHAFMQAVMEYAAGRKNTNSKALWDKLLATDPQVIQDIPPSEFSKKAAAIFKSFPALEARLVAITDFLPEDATLVEREHCVYFRLTERPKCKHCGNEKRPPRADGKFKFGVSDGSAKGDKGYGGDYCSRSCASSSPSTVAKRKATNTERLGVPVPSQSAVIRDKMAATMVERHGVSHAAKSPLLKEQSRARNLAKYGVDSSSPFARPDVQAKVTATHIERYGVSNPMAIRELAAKAGDGRRRDAYAKLFDETRVGMVEPLFSEEEYKGVMLDRERGIPQRYPWRCKVCATEFSDSLEVCSHNGSNKPRCPKCYPPVVSLGEASLREVIVASCHEGADIRYGDRTVLSGYEVDILIPELKLALEYNGLYYHSQFAGGKDSTYHQTKLDRLGALGYRLIYVWEDEWFNQRDAVERVVREACLSGRAVRPGACTVATGRAYEGSAGLYHREGPLGGHVTTYALLFGGVPVATLQVVHRPGKKPGAPGKAAVRYTTMPGFQVPGGLRALLDEASSKAGEGRVFYTELDPSFDDVAQYREAGMVMAKEGSQQQWFLMSPRKYDHRITRTEMAVRASVVDPTFAPDTQLYDSRLQAVGADRIWGVRRQVWEYVHKA